ncbi:unnamed protein product [Closterium sp. NIES-53]
MSKHALSPSTLPCPPLFRLYPPHTFIQVSEGRQPGIRTAAAGERVAVDDDNSSADLRHALSPSTLPSHLTPLPLHYTFRSVRVDSLKGALQRLESERPWMVSALQFTHMPFLPLLDSSPPSQTFIQVCVDSLKGALQWDESERPWMVTAGQSRSLFSVDVPFFRLLGPPLLHLYASHKCRSVRVDSLKGALQRLESEMPWMVTAGQIADMLSLPIFCPPFLLIFPTPHVLSDRGHAMGGAGAAEQAVDSGHVHSGARAVIWSGGGWWCAVLGGGWCWVVSGLLNMLWPWAELEPLSKQWTQDMYILVRGCYGMVVWWCAVVCGAGWMVGGWMVTAGQIVDMPLSKQWTQDVYLLGRLLLGMERRTAAAVWRGMQVHERGALRAILEDSGMGKRIADHALILRAIIARNLPEQLFSLLDAFRAAQEVMPELSATINLLKMEAVWPACQHLPLLIARAVADTFDRFKALLETSTKSAQAMAAAAPPLSSSSASPPPSASGAAAAAAGEAVGGGGGEGGEGEKKASLAKLFRMPFLGRNASTTSASPAAEESTQDVMPPGGVVDPITSYVANYIRSYMRRVPSTHNSYLDVLASLFHLLEEQGAASDEEEEEADGDGEKEGGKGSKSKGDGKVAAGGKAAGGKVDSGKDGGKAGDGKWKRGGQQHTGRSAESETAHLLSALVVNLEARGGLYREEELQHLFLMNNTHYLVQSAADWYRWHVDSLNHPLSQARKEGARDLTAAMADLRDGHIVQLHATAFQSRALAAVSGGRREEGRREGKGEGREGEQQI